MIDFLRPRELRHVYDLVREAGLDVSDWANYKRPKSPQTNPKYCYEWALTDRTASWSACGSTT